MQTEQAYPTIPAIASTEQSALAFAHQSGVNAVWLDALGQVVSRLTQFGETTVPVELNEVLHEIAQQQYIQLESSDAGTLTATLLGQPTLLTNYFWSVWVPRHLLSCGLKVAVTPHLPTTQDEAQHCTVVFRIPGPRETAREFLTVLATQYPGCSPEIVAIQAGDALCQKEAGANA
ncbi:MULTISPECIES: hypothetical protein [Pseudomonas]|uniref:hypothetical protein n=1 Tax=Pseudomonas TaxID=286 RepID=UPI0003DC2823|nr:MULTISPECIES: hypothetical protein [Pseudomonas]ETK13599.1 hypothetical protein H096_32879 [Pseudomonas sp. FH1]MDB1112675.1 hypothetical protein [Pseudomonas extremaustralis]